jgi:hypothetical protein
MEEEKWKKYESGFIRHDFAPIAVTFMTFLSLENDNYLIAVIFSWEIESRGEKMI